jgi:hypothetical protein
MTATTLKVVGVRSESTLEYSYKCIDLSDNTECFFGASADGFLYYIFKKGDRIRINCRFLIMESSQDLVLGWEAIKRFNLMEVNVATISSQNKSNLEKSNIKKCKINTDDNKLHIISYSEVSTNVANINNVKAKSCLKDSFDLVNKISINTMRLDTLKQLMSFNTQVNQHG